MVNKAFLLMMLAFLQLDLAAQMDSQQLKRFLESREFSQCGLRSPDLTKRFYQLNQFAPVWTGTRIKQLSAALDRSGATGLDKANYCPDIIVSLLTTDAGAGDLHLSREMEITFTDVAINFIHDIIYGNGYPSIGYNGLNYSPACRDIVQLFKQVIDDDQLSRLPHLVEPYFKEYKAIKKLIAIYSSVMAASGFTEVRISSKKVTQGNEALMTKLFQLGLVDSAYPWLSDAEIKEKIKAGQRMFNLQDDGVLQPATLQAFNQPISTRLFELKQAINAFRWLSCIRTNQPVIVVNIPSASLFVYRNDSVLLESRIIAGKRSTPTPTLCSRVTEIVLYPYWMVPNSIATRELLPSIKKNIAFLEAGNYQVIDHRGAVVDPYKLNWKAFSPANFPYRLRQSTGCDNALGIIKLNFYNPYSVYLHDTPSKSLFSRSKRFFSHGCMRVEKAIELGRLLLAGNSVAIDTIEEKGCIHNQVPVIVPTIEQTPVFVLYNTAWPDSAGNIRFYEDIYRRQNYTKPTADHNQRPD